MSTEPVNQQQGGTSAQTRQRGAQAAVLAQRGAARCQGWPDHGRRKWARRCGAVALRRSDEPPERGGRVSGGEAQRRLARR